ncbi:MAG: squalene--hopene cyclase, partial [Desulfatitalea sp.]|nr:hypothetical protein [Desulfatitalea sp.]NNK00898.1 squalene--hopene cyclase [Desulfatitalea sp.]
MEAVNTTDPGTPFSDIDEVIALGIDWLETHQAQAGYWVGILESNACMEAEWLLALHFLGIRNDPKQAGLAQGLLDEQRPDGSWEIYCDAPHGDINATVETYAALRAVGLAPDHDALRRARRWIMAHGGLAGIRVFTRFWLALIGEWPWRHTPNIPPEIIFFPKWFPFNIYNFASWARATMVPLAILSARRPVRPLPAHARLDELFPHGRDAFDFSLPKRGAPVSWPRFFLFADRCLHLLQRLHWTPGRSAAIQACLKWVVDHQEADGAWGGIQPPWIYSLMAMQVQGYDLSHPAMHLGLDALNRRWSYKRNGGLHIQACQSPVWDTLLALSALQACRVDYHRSPAMQAAVSWT